MSIRPEGLSLQDIIEANRAIASFLDGVDHDRFLDDELIKSAVLHKLTVVGEAAVRLPQSFKDAHPSIPWRAIMGFRNIAVHAYFSVDWEIVWAAAT